MKVCQLIDLLRGFDLDADVHMQTDRRSFAPPVWIGILDTAGLFDEEKDFQLVISPWEPEEYRRPESDQQRARRKALAELCAYDQELGLTDDRSDDKKRD